MPFEVGAFAVEELAADVAVHFVAVVARRNVLVTHLFVHEGFRTSRKRAFERPFVGGAVAVPGPPVGRGRL